MLRAPYTYHRVASEYIQSALLHRKRFGAGVPMVNGVDSSEIDAETAQSIRDSVARYMNHQEAYIYSPDGISMSILPPVADGDLLGVLQFCVDQKRQALGANLFDLGSGNAGSWALMDQQSQLWLKLLDGFFWQISSGYRPLARAYCDTYFNAGESGHLVYPEMRITGFATRSPIETIELHTSIANLRGAVLQRLT